MFPANCTTQQPDQQAPPHCWLTLTPCRYCTSLNVLTAEAAAAAAQPAATASQQQRKTGAKSVGRKAAAVAQADDGSGSGSAAGSPQQQEAASLSPGSRRRASSSISSGARYILAQTAASVAPDLPPVLHYNCQKHVFLQRLDHFATTTPKSPAQPGDKEPVPGGCVTGPTDMVVSA